MGKKRRSWKRWTKEEDERLYGLMRAGKYIHEIANRMEDRTESSITGRIYSNKFLCDAYRQFSPRRGYRGRQSKMLTIVPTPEQTVEAPEVDLTLVNWAATVGAISSAATFLLVLGAMLS